MVFSCSKLDYLQWHFSAFICDFSVGNARPGHVSLKVRISFTSICHGWSIHLEAFVCVCVCVLYVSIVFPCELINCMSATSIHGQHDRLLLSSSLPVVSTYICIFVCSFQHTVRMRRCNHSHDVRPMFTPCTLNVE